MAVASSERIDARSMRVLGFPMMIGSLVAALIGLFDVAVVGRLGVSAMAGVAGGVVVFEIASNVVMAASVGARVLIPRALGAQDAAAGVRVVTAASSLQAVLGTATAVLLIVFAHPFAVAVIGSGSGVIGTATTFIRITAVTVLLQSVGTVATAYLASARRSDLVLRFGLVAVSANLVLDVPFVFGVGNWSGFGPTGAAVATVVGYCMSVVASWASVHRLLRSEPHSVRSSAAPVRWATLLSISWPAMTSAVFDYVGTAVFFGIISRSGGADLAGGRLAYQLSLFAFVMLGGFGAAATVLLGRNHGARGSPDVPGEHFVLRYFGFAGVVTGVALLAVGFPVGTVVGLHGSALHTYLWAVAVVAASAVPMARCVGSTAVLRYRGATGRELLSNLASVWMVEIPVAALCALLWGPSAAFLGFLGYWLVRALLNEVLVRRIPEWTS